MKDEELVARTKPWRNPPQKSGSQEIGIDGRKSG